MALMQKLEHHPHVLRSEHVILEEQEIHLVMSICRGGDLQNWPLGVDMEWLNQRFDVLFDVENWKSHAFRFGK